MQSKNLGNREVPLRGRQHKTWQNLQDYWHTSHNNWES